MTVPTRFSKQQIDTIDRLVAKGLGENRSEVIRKGLEHFAGSTERAQIGVSIAGSYRALPQTPDEDAQAMANAVAMTEAELW